MKRPIDTHRDAAVFMQIDDPSDQSPLQEFIQVAGNLLIVSEKSIWRVQLADSVDPERTNPGIPNSQQKVLGRGTGDPLVCRTLLQAKRLLKKHFLPTSCNLDEGMSATLDFLSDADAAQTKADDFRSLTERLDGTLKNSASKQQGMTIPAVGDVSARGKAFIQAADHAVRHLWRLARALDPGLPVEGGVVKAEV